MKLMELTSLPEEMELSPHFPHRGSEMGSDNELAGEGLKPSLTFRSCSFHSIQFTRYFPSAFLGGVVWGYEDQQSPVPAAGRWQFS